MNRCAWKASIVLAYSCVACGPSIDADPDHATIETAADGTTDHPRMRSFAYDDGEVLVIVFTNSSRPTCEEPYDLGDVESDCPDIDFWAVRLLLETPYPANAEGVRSLSRSWSAEPCGYGSSSDYDAVLALDAMTDDRVDGHASFTVLDQPRDVGFSAPMCP